MRPKGPGRVFLHSIALLLLLPLYILPGRCEARSVHDPVVAGAFYPSDPGQLREMVVSFLDTADEIAVRGEVLGLIAPHAGYVYSGPVAGHAYAAVRGKAYDLVVVIAPSHSSSIPGVSVLDMDAYRTPLGEVPIDRRTVRSLMDQATWVDYIPALFAREHSMEVELPFLQAALKPGFKLLPVVMGSPDPKLASALADLLADTLRGRKVLFVASSDMSHYHGYDEARSMDLETLGFIRDGDLKTLEDRCFAGKSEMCGLGPVQVLMHLAEKAGIDDGTILKYMNSGDTAGDRTRVVGYGAAAFVNSEDSLSLSDKQALLTLARDTLERYVRDGKIPDTIPGSAALRQPGAAFVTLKKREQLRGCIGQLRPTGPLYRSITDMAVAACSRDPRFRPVQPDELDNIRIEISVMSPFMEVKSVDEIEVGRDGLYLTAAGRSGVLLPQVPGEMGWDRREYLKGICRKAGLPDNAWERKDAKLYRFSAEVFGE